MNLLSFFQSDISNVNIKLVTRYTSICAPIYQINSTNSPSAHVRRTNICGWAQSQGCAKEASLHSEEGDWRFGGGEWTEGQPQVHQPPKPVPLLPLQHRVIIIHLLQIAAIFFVNVNDAKINFIKDSISIDLVERLHPRSKFVQNLFFRVSPRLHCHPCCSAVGERGHNVSHMDV